MEIQSAEAESSTSNDQRRNSRDHWHRGQSRDRRDRSRDRRRRSRSRDYNNRHDRKDRRDYYHRERTSKWDSDGDGPGLGQGQMPVMPVGNMIAQGNMLTYNNILQNSLMGHQQMEVHSIMPGMNIIPNMIDQNMMLQQQMVQVIPNQQIFITCGTLLPPIPGSSIPPRRERPKGCRTIVVGGLPATVTSDIVMEIFQRFGEITEVKTPRHGIYHVRFALQEAVDQALFLSGYRFKCHDQMENEATIMFIDYTANRDDEMEYERNQRRRSKTPPRVEPFTQTALSTLTEKIKSEDEFVKSAPTLAIWLERGECNKKNANIFYSLIQVSNNQLRRLFNEKMQLDEEFHNLKSSMREKFAHVILQFEQVAKILSAARHQRVSDHFTKQQRRNVDMWLKMTQEVENIKEEFNNNFMEEEVEKGGSNKCMVSQEKYIALKTENENLTYELEGYKNEAHLAKNEAERKFEKFKAHFIAQQALQNKQAYPSLAASSFVAENTGLSMTNKALMNISDDKTITTGPSVEPSEAKLISILTAFLMVHPLGASLDYLVSYIRSLIPNVTHAAVHQILQKFTDVFHCKTSGVGASIEHRWTFITFDTIKSEG
ncbi:ecto-NOX disulfide-thiol exchanger 2-like isoform X2 [Battus philenor]